MFLPIAILLSLLGSIQAATNVGGVLLNNAIWASSGSANPYYLIKDVQIPRNVTLTIQPGVKIDFSQGDFEIFIKGVVIVQGTFAQPITFQGGSANDLKWMLNFQSTQLSNSSISFAKFKGPKNALELSDAAPNLPTNTGTLLIQSSTFTDDTQIGPNSQFPNYNDPSVATIELRSCSINQTTLSSVQGTGGPIRIITSTINYAILYPRANYRSLQIINSTVKNLTVIYDTGAGQIELINSIVINSTSITQNVGYPGPTFTVLQSVVRDMSFSYGSNFGFGQVCNLVYQNSTMSNISIVSLSTYQYSTWNISISNCNFTLGDLILGCSYGHMISIQDSVLSKVNISVCNQNYDNNDNNAYNYYYEMNMNPMLTMYNTEFKNGVLSTRGLPANILYSTITLVQTPFAMSGNSRILCSSISRSGLIAQNDTLGLIATGLQIQKSTIKNFAIGIQFPPTDLNTATISKTNFQSLSDINIDNKGPYDVVAKNNYWGTNNVAVINNKILDYWDDIHYGEVIYTNFSMNSLPAEAGCVLNEGWDVDPQDPSQYTTFPPWWGK